MKRISFSALALAVAVLGAATPSRGEDFACEAAASACDLGCETGCDVGCDTCEVGCDECSECETCDEGCDSGGCYAEIEATFFRYHREDGVRTGEDDADVVEFDFELNPRITLGYVGSDGLGLRARYWTYDEVGQDLDGDDDEIHVDTLTFDVEIFETIDLNCNWTAELSGGLRFNDFHEQLEDGGDGNEVENDFEGFGGLVGLKVARKINDYAAVFSSIRGAILMDDKHQEDETDDELTFTDSVVGMIELQLGVEARRDLDGGAYVFAKAAGEWQTWLNYSSVRDTGTNLNDVEGGSDVGFGGVVFSVGVAR